MNDIVQRNDDVEQHNNDVDVDFRFSIADCR